MICTRINIYIGLVISLFAFLIVVESCSNSEQTSQRQDLAFSVRLPPTFPNFPPSPQDNALTAARVALGEMLFHEIAISEDGSISCASCHKAHLAYADDVALSLGVHGRSDSRNAPSLLNVAYQKALFAEGGVPSLEAQVLAPFGNPNEMGLSVKDAAARLARLPIYDSLARAAYGTELNAYAFGRALAAFQRTLVSSGSRYDAYLMGDSSALGPEAKRGRDLFYSEEIGCATCHSGILFTDQGYYNVGLYSAYADEGRGRLTLDPADLGKFKTPSLRNVAITAPYMHDGSIATLDAVLWHFNRGGVGHPNQAASVKPLGLDSADVKALRYFLESLTDMSFETDSSY